MSMDWITLGASVEGVTHRRDETPCQDANASRVLENGTLLVVVADGAGSATRSAEGSKCAVEIAIAALAAAVKKKRPREPKHWKGVMAHVVLQARAGIEALAEAEMASVEEFHTTLTCVIVTDDALIVGQVGDGFVVARTKTGKLFVAMPPMRGEYANETFFITMPHPLNYLDVRPYRGGIQALAASTDGLIPVAIQRATGQPAERFFHPMFDSLAREDRGDEAVLRDYLASEAVCAKTDDDKTLVLALDLAAPMQPAPPDSEEKAVDTQPGKDESRDQEDPDSEGQSESGGEAEEPVGDGAPTDTGEVDPEPPQDGVEASRKPRRASAGRGDLPHDKGRNPARTAGMPASGKPSAGPPAAPMRNAPPALTSSSDVRERRGFFANLARFRFWRKSS